MSINQSLLSNNSIKSLLKKTFAALIVIALPSLIVACGGGGSSGGGGGTTGRELINPDTLDKTAPTVTFNSAPPDYKSDEQFIVKAQFSEPVSDFSVDDIVVENATITINGISDTYTIIVTPTGTGAITLSIRSNTVQDSAENMNDASEVLTITPYQILTDANKPHVVLADAPLSYSDRSPFTITAIFSEAVNNFVASDIEAVNADISLTGSGDVYTITATPTGTGFIAIRIPADAAEDSESNGNLVSRAVYVPYAVPPDTMGPTVGLFAAPTYNGVDGFYVPVAFSEAVEGFTAADVSVSNASVEVSGLGANYTLLVRPTAPAEITISILALGATDRDGIGNAASEVLRVAYVAPPPPVPSNDVTRPTITISAPASHLYAVFQITVIFSEVVRFSPHDITVTGGSVLDTDAVGMEANTYTALIVPSSSSDISIRIGAGAAHDLANNSNLASDVVNIEFGRDQVAPTITSLTVFTVIAPDASGTRKGEVITAHGGNPFIVEITFSDSESISLNWVYSSVTSGGTLIGSALNFMPTLIEDYYIEPTDGSTHVELYVAPYYTNELSGSDNLEDFRFTIPAN